MAEITVIIPALNEEQAIGRVLAEIPKAALAPLNVTIIVADNGSSDRTAEIARAAGALTVREEERGYGAACLKALQHLPAECRYIVFLDGDYSDYPHEMPLLLQPLLNNQADIVIGSRVLGQREKGSLSPQQRFGNALAVTLIRWFWGVKFTDLGPFRAIRREAFERLAMRDRNYGWTVELQIKAAKLKLRCLEVPVSYRRRIGKSKVSGTIKGTVLAGYVILKTIFLSALPRFR